MNDPMQRAPARDRGSKKSAVRLSNPDDSSQLGMFAPTEDGQSRRDHGMKAAEHAAHPWVKSAVDDAIARRVASRRPFVSDDVRDDVPLLASSPNVLGARINAAARRGDIVKTGNYVQSRNASRHGGVVAEWTAA